MKNLSVIFAIVILILAEKGFAQSFVNLNFEHPVLPLVPDAGGMVPTTNAVPGRTAYAFGNVRNSILYNTVALGGAAVSFHNSASSLQPIQGNYSVNLQTASTGSFGPAAIGQTGQIPLTAESLVLYGTTVMQVTFGGQPIPLVQLGSGVSYQMVGADISAFAGQTGELRFTLPHLSFDAASYLDNIQFSTQPIPEPSSFVLLGVNALLLGFFRRRNCSR